MVEKEEQHISTLGDLTAAKCMETPVPIDLPSMIMSSSLIFNEPKCKRFKTKS